MAMARRRDEWDRAALLAAILANAHRDADARPEPFEVWDFHPLRRRPKPTQPREKVTARQLVIAAFGPATPSRRG